MTGAALVVTGAEPVVTGTVLVTGAEPVVTGGALVVTGLS